MYKRILVGVDGSKQATQALDRAIQLTQKYDATLIIAHVIDMRNMPSAVEVHGTDILAAWEESGKELLAGSKQKAEQAGLNDVETVLSFGNPRSEASKGLVKKHKADLLITAATGRNRIERFLTGSVAEAAVRNAASDYLMVKQDGAADTFYEGITVAVDGSEESIRAFETAIELAKQYRASLKVIHVLEAEESMRWAEFYTQDFVLKEKEKAQQMLEKYRKEAIDKEVKEVMSEVKTGNPRVVIPETFTDRSASQLLVMGATGSNIVSKVFVGSVAEAAMRRSYNDVLVVKNTTGRDA